MTHDNDLILMPINLHLLTTLFRFDLIELPTEFDTLVRTYYKKQCRGCKRQLQESALCLLCGEIVCFMTNQKCCKDRPGMKVLPMR